MACCSPEKEKTRRNLFRRVEIVPLFRELLRDHGTHTPPDTRIRWLRIRDVVAVVVVRTNIRRAV
jgi:hypothetical protein